MKAIKAIYSLKAIVAVIGLTLLSSGHAQSRELWKYEFWGAETNGLKAGLAIGYAARSANTNSVVCIALLKNCKTNNGNMSPDHLRLWIPPLTNRFQLTLLDVNQNEIPRTRAGKLLGQPITQPLKLMKGVNLAAGYQSQILIPGEESQIQEFALSDYFDVKKPGEYRLKFELEVVWITQGYTNSLRTTIPPPTIRLPPVEADIRVPTQNSAMDTK